MPSRHILASIAALAGLVAAGSAAAEIPAACPSTPLRVIRSVGEPVVYDGTYPGVPDLCQLGPVSAQLFFYFGIWRMEWPGAGSAYPAMKTAIDGPTGTSVSFVTRAIPGLQWTDTITNEGPETLMIGGRPYRTLKMAHERTGIEGNTYHSIITVWRDIQTGANLKVVEDQIAGQSYGPGTTWTATAVEPVP